MGCVTRAQIPSTNYRVKPVQFLEDMFQIVVNKSLQKLPPERPTFFFWKADISLRLETLQTCQVVIRYYQIDHPSFHLRVLQPYIFDFIRKAWLLSLSLSTFCLLLGFHSDFGMEAPPPKREPCDLHTLRAGTWPRLLELFVAGALAQFTRDDRRRYPERRGPICASGWSIPVGMVKWMVGGWRMVKICFCVWPVGTENGVPKLWAEIFIIFFVASFVGKMILDQAMNGAPIRVHPDWLCEKITNNFRAKVLPWQPKAMQIRILTRHRKRLWVRFLSEQVILKRFRPPQN